MALLTAGDLAIIAQGIQDAFDDQAEAITINSNPTLQDDELKDVNATWANTYSLNGIVFHYYNYKKEELPASFQELETSILQKEAYIVLLQNKDISSYTINSQSLVTMRSQNYIILGKVVETYLTRLLLILNK